MRWARQLQRLCQVHHDKPQRFASPITEGKNTLASIIKPNFKSQSDSEEYYPPQWTKQPRPLVVMLRNFRATAELFFKASSLPCMEDRVPSQNSDKLSLLAHRSWESGWQKWVYCLLLIALTTVCFYWLKDMGNVVIID
jgi:hypothetical protein